MQAVRLATNGRHVVFGLPGSGKTLCLVHRAKYLMEECRINPDKLRVFVYTKVLKDYIRDGLRDLDIPDQCVSTLDAWCVERYRELVSRHLPDTGHGPDFDRIRKDVLQTLDGPVWDYVLVDEGQDLDETQWDILSRASKNLTVCMDFMQQIFDTGTDEQAVWSKLGVQRRRLHLLTLLRCSPFVVETAAPLIDDPDLREAFMRQARTIARGGDKTLLYYASDWEDEKRRLVEVIRARQQNGDKIGVLFPMNKQVHGFAQGLREAGLEVDTPGGRFDPATLDFSNGKPKVLNYHQVKGLTFDSILLPRLVTGSFRRMSEERIRRLLFVGITRATKWVYMSTCGDSALPALKELLPLAAAGKLEIQRGPDLFHVNQPAGQPAPAHEPHDLTDI